MSLGSNQLHPLEIEGAREAAHKASELQRKVEDDLRAASAALAEAERVYRSALARRIVELHAGDGEGAGVAWSIAGDVARGDKQVAGRRYARDVAEGVLEAMRQQAFRRGSDRRDLDTLLNWSMRRDLRTDAAPANGGGETFGRRGA